MSGVRLCFAGIGGCLLGRFCVRIVHARSFCSRLCVGSVVRTFRCFLFCFFHELVVHGFGAFAILHAHLLVC